MLRLFLLWSPCRQSRAIRESVLNMKNPGQCHASEAASQHGGNPEISCLAIRHGLLRDNGASSI